MFELYFPLVTNAFFEVIVSRIFTNNNVSTFAFLLRKWRFVGDQESQGFTCVVNEGELRVFENLLFLVWSNFSTFTRFFSSNLNLYSLVLTIVSYTKILLFIILYDPTFITCFLSNEQQIFICIYSQVFLLTTQEFNLFDPFFKIQLVSILLFVLLISFRFFIFQVSFLLFQESYPLFICLMFIFFDFLKSFIQRQGAAISQV